VVRDARIGRALRLARADPAGFPALLTRRLAAQIAPYGRRAALRGRRLTGTLSSPAYPVYRRRFSMRLAEWALHHQSLLTEPRWLGVRALKNPLDAWIYQEIIFELRPSTIVEIGGAFGGGSMYLASMLDLLGSGRVVSVEINRAQWQAPEHPRIVKVDGDCSSAEVVARVADLVEGVTMVIHDADHSAAAVARDLELYAPFVTVGSYFIVEDGIVDLFRPSDGIGSKDPGPLPAIEAFLRTHPEFEVDERRERYVMTYNPRGFLRRVAR
jgi:cephalosporin hydroxylase